MSVGLGWVLAGRVFAELEIRCPDGIYRGRLPTGIARIARIGALDLDLGGMTAAFDAQRGEVLDVGGDRFGMWMDLLKRLGVRVLLRF